MSAGSDRIAGFTIVELMVSLAVAAILIGFALPAFTDFIDQRRMASRANDFVMAVTYARSEATRLGGVVSVQAAGGNGGNEWGEGYCVVAGTPGNCAGTVLRRFEGFDDATFDATGGLHNQYTLSFNGRGMLTLGLPGDIELCSTDDSEDPGRVINLSAIGRPDVEEHTCHP